MLLQQLFNGLIVGSVYALFAFGFTLIFGVQRILNLAYGALFMWGAFAGLYAITLLDLPLPLAFLAGGLAGGIVCVVVDLLALRPLRKRKASEFAAIVTTVGANLVLVSIAQQVSDTQVLRYPFGTFPVEIYRLFGLRISLLQITILCFSAVVVLTLMYIVFRTSFGRQVRAVALSETTASLLGVNANAVFLKASFVAGTLAGFAGVIIGIAFNSVHFHMGDPWLLKAFVVVVLGGIGSIIGAVVAGIGIGIVETMATALLSVEAAEIILFSMLFLVLLVRPAGLFGGLRNDVKVSRR
ncbi:branched-chain amino acid ABC transporter permease [Zavarzinia compransoris]|uniref:Branched-chain amino acid ABC transporter permease n=1 Tax=Zavarzinia compransoris TaxID=1264899 RepID=A0A317E4T0_9PROT|nr:branched-chain amino acid ABC transporter permease [Zavarzinia compransoris]PWR21651.1 branched-chain amino acid ABC transporter permease [Zavarzinia compransoris]TDP45568.1 amino acid/amide ABC transporter membrane protein 1 (HAAT family) [Zavarzinia compransoris]